MKCATSSARVGWMRLFTELDRLEKKRQQPGLYKHQNMRRGRKEKKAEAPQVCGLVRVGAGI